MNGCLIYLFRSLRYPSVGATPENPNEGVILRRKKSASVLRVCFVTPDLLCTRKWQSGGT